ncbi:MAG: hypothetical protein A3K19_19480 [Lentisphaerae bacterium RIFOXYB12_FULL_65_16]|nr:MAG: hypothetical protein A3K18_31335 [Lentisphaerae bacterium RIFOXYA12_64_32]OGV92044.1 MAG: hypothetical protein A3K19_19480 [Lentisphaerae bacterium RIFOXYB12_FULL_65_16]
MSRIGTTLRHGWFHLVALLSAAAIVTLVIGQARHIKSRCDRDAAESRSRSQFNLAMWSEKGRHGLREEALKQLQALPDVDLSSGQRRQRDLAIVEFLFSRVQEHLSGDAEGDLRRAELLLLPILKSDTDRAVQARVRNLLVLVGFEQRKWYATLQRIDSLLADFPESHGNTELALLKAICLSQVQDCPRALKLCEEIIGKATDSVRARAHLEAGDAILKGLRNGGVLALARGQNWPTDEKGATATALREARAHYEKALTGMPPGTPSRTFVLNGLVDTCVLTNDLDSARHYAEETNEPLVPVSERIRSYLLMAQVEQKFNHIPEATRLLQACLQEFPQEPESVEAHFRLFELYRQTRNWQDGAALLHKLIVRFSDRTTATRMLNLFLDSHSTLVDEICEGNKPTHLIAFRDVLVQLKRQSPPLWSQVHEGVDYLLGLMEIKRGEDQRAEEEFLRYLTNPLHLDFRERVLFDDLRCAVRLQRSPAVVAYRARRYLARYASSPRNQEARLRLVEAYFDMDLYAGAIQAAAEGDMPRVLKSNPADPSTPTRAGLACAVQTAQAYARLGNADKANPLFRASLQQTRGIEFPAAAFLDWADTAIAAGQTAEASRRLELGVDRLQDPQARSRLEVARDILHLRMALPEAETEALKRLDALQAQAEKDPKARACWRELCETLLDFHCTRGALDPATAVLTQACRVFPGESWVDGWLSRLLRLKLDKSDTAAAVTWLAGIPAEVGGGEKADSPTSGLWQRQQELVRRVALLSEQVRKRQENDGAGGEHVARN